MSKKIYVGNISYKALEEDIEELFSKIGTVESVKIIKDSHTGQPKGFGFVEMASEDDVKKAIEMLNNTLFMERTLSVAQARTERKKGQGFEGKRKEYDKKRGPTRQWR
jgi:RNA recognition motif-containing protein